jgi:hypothetical protein
MLNRPVHSLGEAWQRPSAATAILLMRRAFDPPHGVDGGENEPVGISSDIGVE